jgi:hypothetical protein
MRFPSWADERTNSGYFERKVPAHGGVVESDVTINQVEADPHFLGGCNRCQVSWFSFICPMWCMIWRW